MVPQGVQEPPARSARASPERYLEGQPQPTPEQGLQSRVCETNLRRERQRLEKPRGELAPLGKEHGLARRRKLGAKLELQKAHLSDAGGVALPPTGPFARFAFFRLGGSLPCR